MDLKSTFESLRGRATEMAQAGVAQSKRLAEIAKLKMSNMAEEDAVKKAYLEIGKLYYAEQGASPDGAYAAACERITAAKAAIEANNDRIAELKRPGDPEIDPETEIEIEMSMGEIPDEEAPAEEQPADEDKQD